MNKSTSSATGKDASKNLKYFYIAVFVCCFRAYAYVCEWLIDKFEIILQFVVAFSLSFFLLLRQVIWYGLGRVERVLGSEDGVGNLGRMAQRSRGLLAASSVGHQPA
jgi:hypothetical protein